MTPGCLGSKIVFPLIYISFLTNSKMKRKCLPCSSVCPWDSSKLGSILKYKPWMATNIRRVFCHLLKIYVLSPNTFGSCTHALCSVETCFTHSYGPVVRIDVAACERRWHTREQNSGPNGHWPIVAEAHGAMHSQTTQLAISNGEREGTHMIDDMYINEYIYNIIKKHIMYYRRCFSESQ